MKTKQSDLNALAEDWSGAYRADWKGRAVSIAIIKALLDYGFSELDAREVYFSKHLRWFFDSQDDKANPKTVGSKLKLYLDKNMGHIRGMIEFLGRKCSI